MLSAGDVPKARPYRAGGLSGGRGFSAGDVPKARPYRVEVFLNRSEDEFIRRRRAEGTSVQGGSDGRRVPEKKNLMNI